MRLHAFGMYSMHVYERQHQIHEYNTSAASPSESDVHAATLKRADAKHKQAQVGIESAFSCLLTT